MTRRGRCCYSNTSLVPCAGQTAVTGFPPMAGRGTWSCILAQGRTIPPSIANQPCHLDGGDSQQGHYCAQINLDKARLSQLFDVLLHCLFLPVFGLLCWFVLWRKNSHGFGPMSTSFSQSSFSLARFVRALTFASAIIAVSSSKPSPYLFHRANRS